MNVVEEAVTAPCVNHPNRETALRCGKCGNPICPRCVVQTPVGARCKPCAGLRKLPQYEVSPLLLARSGLAGFGVALLAWFFVSSIPYLLYFLSILVGIAVSETMSRLAKRRSNLILEAIAVVDIVAALVVLDLLRGYDLATFLTVARFSGGTLIALALPAAIASFVAVVRLR